MSRAINCIRGVGFMPVPVFVRQSYPIQIYHSQIFSGKDFFRGSQRCDAIDRFKLLYL